MASYRKSLLAVSLVLGAGAAAAQSLPGVADAETTIPYASNGIEDFQVGKGDVLFVRDRTNRWYRVALNEGCLSKIDGYGAISFDAGPDDRLDKLSTVRFSNQAKTCLVDSIRRSAPPPQVDQDSPVTLD